MSIRPRALQAALLLTACVSCGEERVINVTAAVNAQAQQPLPAAKEPQAAAPPPPASGIVEEPPEQATPEPPPSETDAAERHRVLGEMVDGIEERHKRLIGKCRSMLSRVRSNAAAADFEWSQWSREYNRDFYPWRDAQTSTLEDWGLGPGAPETDEERVAFDIGVATGDLLQLWFECNGRMSGRDGDIAYFDRAVKSGVRSARAGLRRLTKHRR